jgi:hypothetical protein
MTAASESAANEVDPDNRESVARNIRRYLERNSSRIGPEQAGLGMLYPLLWTRLELLMEEVNHLLQTDEQFAAAARKAARIRAIVARRLAELNALGPKEAATQARALLCGLQDIDPSMTPEAVISREIHEVTALLKKAEETQADIYYRRPIPSCRPT